MSDNQLKRVVTSDDVFFVLFLRLMPYIISILTSRTTF